MIGAATITPVADRLWIGRNDGIREVLILFRFKKGVPLRYEEQGYIYFTSLRYKQLTANTQRLIRRLCKECGGEHHRALFDFVTTDVGATAVCNRYFLSRSTLERLVKKYYIAFAQSL